MEYNIAIIGCGQLGRRYLEGMLNSGITSRLYTIDPSEEALELAKQVANEHTSSLAEVFFSQSFTALPDQLDLVIIATTADVRRKVFDVLIGSVKLKYLIFEKYLFQNRSHYEDILEVVHSNGIQAWVNCPRRMYPEYRNLKKELSKSQIAEINVYGNNWNIASNSIHFIDLMAFLLNDSEYLINGYKTYPLAVKPKRPNQMEFYGWITGAFSKGCRFTLSSDPASNSSIFIEIITDSGRVFIDQNTRKLFRSLIKDLGWSHSEEDFGVHFQSELTPILIEDVLVKNHVKLTPLEESIRLHLPLHKVLIEIFGKLLNNKDLATCPVT